MPDEAQRIAEQALHMPDGTAVPLLGAWGVLWLLVALFALGASGLLSQVARIGFRFGIDAGRSAARGAGLLRLAGWLVVGSVALQAVFAQLSTGAGLWLLLGLLGLLALTGMVRDAAGSLHAQFRLQLGEGDRVRVGALSGEIRRIAWDHLRLRAENGEGILLPGRALLSEPVEVQALRDAVVLDELLATPLGPEAVTRLRDAVSVCPYRVPATPMSAQPGPGGVMVSLWVWSPQAVAPARELLQRTARALVEHGAEGATAELSDTLP